MPLSREEFVRRYRNASLSERATAQTHFLDLCDMLGQPHPVAADSAGERYTFEKRVRTTSGNTGFADVWMRDHFAWEYKKRKRDLKAAYQQLRDYQEDLGNPPLLVVCDFERFEIHTQWTSERPRVYSFNLKDLELNKATATCPLPPFEVLRALFTDLNRLRPRYTDAHVTQEAAKTFSRLAERLEIEKRALTDTPIHTREEIAHFLMRLLFCLFADSIGLLPDRIFSRLVQSDDRFSPGLFLRKLRVLFQAMSEPSGIFGEHSIKYFNGGLFDSASLIELDLGDLGILWEASKNFDWSHVRPEIFGTLFERSLNAERRSLIGAHYTSAEDILLLIEPVIMQPLEARWHVVRESLLAVLEREKAAGGATTLLRSSREAETLLAGWFDELAAVRVLDPACGSGNFLYMALRRLLDLWNEARVFAIDHDIQIFTTYAIEKMVSPEQLYGIEIDFLAHELASVVVWIGFLQWKKENTIPDAPEPLLRKLSNIERGDAILRYDAEGKPYEPEWPPADFIVGNPPFLGGNRLRRELANSFVDDLQRLYQGRVAAGADLVTYWFEKSRGQIARCEGVRAGLIATQAIRGGVNRFTLQAIKNSGDIFLAWSDREWKLAGALVHVSVVGFDDGSTATKMLNGNKVASINAGLTHSTDAGMAVTLVENKNLCFRADEKGGPFELTDNESTRIRSLPLNVNGRENSDVVRRWLNASDVTQRPRNMWIIDFFGLSKREAAKYEVPFALLRKRIDLEKSSAVTGKRLPALDRAKWWLHRRPGSLMRKATSTLNRYIATTSTSKHRLFVWLDRSVLPDHQLYIVAREDDFFFGLLQSGIHEMWSRFQGTQLRDVVSGFRYTPDTTFDTFPFPWPPGTEPSEADSPIVRAIADAARELVRLRDAWLNPPGAAEADLRKRTLTNLYNQRPAWLDHAHRTLDEAVFAAYGWPATLAREELLERLLVLNHERAAAQQPDAPKTARPQVSAPGSEPAPRPKRKPRARPAAAPPVTPGEDAAT